MIHPAPAKNPQLWNNFLIQNQGSVLQSWEWGKVEGKSLKLKIKAKNQTLAQGLFLEKKLPFNKKYFYCPWGPIINLKISSTKTKLKILKLFIQEIQRNQKIFFIRFEPPKKIIQNNLSFLAKKDKRFSWQKTKNIQPQNLWILNLQKSLEQILYEMKPKTRYNIRLAEKRGVKVEAGENKKFLEIFYHLLQKTSQRHQFKIHPKQHYQKILEIFKKNKLIKIFTAFYQKQPLAAGMVTFFGPEAYYIHGASSSKLKNLMAPYLMHWKAVEQAKKQGCKVYNFGGVDQKGWEGITRFKKSFGGIKLCYPQAGDVVLDKKWYKIYRLSKAVLSR